MRLIDADVLINTLQELFDKRDKEARFTGDRGVTVTWNDAIYHIKTAPTIEERKTGKWIRGKCDQCGAHAPFWPMASTYYESDYCPNCGADMRKTT